MTRIAPIASLCALLWLIPCGCAHRSDTITSNQRAYEKMEAETERAIELERRADVVVDYEGADRIRLWTPGQAAYISATDETLAAALAGATLKRELALVIIGPPVRHAFSEQQLRTKVDSIEAILKGQGFSRVVFHLASAFGRTIYRE